MTKRTGVGLQRSWKKVLELSHTQMAQKWSVREATDVSSMDAMTSSTIQPLHKITMPNIFIGFISWFQRSGFKST